MSVPWMQYPSLRELFHPRPPAQDAYPIGVLRGEGIGPEVVGAALLVLDAIAERFGLRFELREGGPIGLESERRGEPALSEDVVRFCGEVFRDGGAILAGAGGGRFVYDMRREFDLFCKVSPLVRVVPEATARLSHDAASSADILLVRDNAAGVYQGEWSESRDERGDVVARHTFEYRQDQVERILRVGCWLANRRRNQLTVVTKSHGIPSISRLWIETAGRLADQFRVSLRVLDIDYACFLLAHEPREFDVVVTSNLFGDILSDLGGLILGGRGLCFGGSFSPEGEGVFQTNHGAAYDLAGQNRANPVGQILSLAMLLHDAFGLTAAAVAIDAAIATVYAKGFRTEEMIEGGRAALGTKQMAKQIARSVLEQAELAAP